jgi:catechol 2,3-dioxygenase-like lactoylglutathione lyase family enzyme
MARGQLDAVGLIVSDLSRSVRFYRSLGVPFPDGAEQSGHGHAEADLGGGFRLMLDTEAGIRSFDPSWAEASGGQPRASIAIRFTGADEVDEAFAVSLEFGGKAHKEPWNAFWGQRYAQLCDPDGNAVDLYAELRPGS